jgi:hypothetical protein
MTKSLAAEMKKQQVRQALLEGRSQNWIEVNLKVSYQTIVKERNTLQIAGTWPPKPREKYLEVGGKSYMNHAQFRELYKDVLQSMIRECSTTLEKCVSAGQLMPDGSVPPDLPSFDPDSAFYCLD